MKKFALCLELEYSVRILISRLMDFVDKGKVNFENLKYLVLYKADRSE